MRFTRETGFLLFRIIVPLVFLIIQFLLYRMTYRWARKTFPDSPRVRTAIAAPFILFTAAFFAMMLLRLQTLALPGWLKDLVVYPSSVWIGATLMLGLLSLAAVLIALPFRISWFLARTIPPLAPIAKRVSSSPPVLRFDASRRTFIRRGVYGLTAVSFAGNAYGLLAAKTEHEITERQFTIRNLPAALDGFTITLLSDVHSSIYMTKADMDGYVQLVNAMHSDVIVVPGDFVSGLTEEVYPFAEAFSNLQAPHGVFGVTGNHEYYTQDPDTVIREVDACGIRLLHDESVPIRKDGAEFLMVGIDDVANGHLADARLHTALRGSTAGVPRILLCHRPYYLQQAADHGVDLMLSGHTHGGQIVLGQIGNTVITPASLASTYVWGPYRKGTTQMYVSRGIGTVGLPIRINCPSEITRITLKRPDEPTAHA